jgi:hypothetical protein
MWRAILLAMMACIVLQLSSAPSASAVDSKGKWVLSRIHGGLNMAYADFNNDCAINVLDEQASAFRYGSFYGLLLYDQRFDLEPQAGTYDYPPPHDAQGYEIGDDWDIDIKDLQVVFGRDGGTCVVFWDPNVSMGEYSYKDSTPTGPGTACGVPVTNPPGSAYYVDPIGTVFFADATASRLEQEAQAHGFPDIEHNPEQRFWETGQCSFEDVDARYNREWTCTWDPCESWHFRAEVGADESSWGGGHVNWGKFAVATPHFDDDQNVVGCGHFVPEVFPYPEELYPGFAGSGFEAGTYWVYLQFVVFGGHGFAGTEYWGNTRPIQQCKTDEWPEGDGHVYYIEIF